MTETKSSLIERLSSILSLVISLSLVFLLGFSLFSFLSGETRSITPTPAPRLIYEGKFFVKGVQVEDITQPYYLTDTRQIRIKFKVRDISGETISDDEISCDWMFFPSSQHQTVDEEQECSIGYQIPEDLDGQLVKVTVRGKDNRKIDGLLTKSVNVLRAGENISNE